MAEIHVFMPNYRPDMTFAVDLALKTNYLSIMPKLFFSAGGAAFPGRFWPEAVGNVRGL